MELNPHLAHSNTTTRKMSYCKGQGTDLSVHPSGKEPPEASGATNHKGIRTFGLMREMFVQTIIRSIFHSLDGKKTRGREPVFKNNLNSGLISLILV